MFLVALKRNLSLGRGTYLEKAEWAWVFERQNFDKEDMSVFCSGG